MQVDRTKHWLLHWNCIYGCIAYADDIALLAPTTRAMRLMLGICDDFAQEHAIVFNAKE